MKLVKVTTFYPFYWRRHYAERPELASLPYKPQLERLLADRFGWSDYWSRALAPLGYECAEIVANVDPLQAAWCRENGREWEPGGPIQPVVFDQVRRAAPDILWLDDYVSFGGEWVRELKQACPGIRLVLGWCGAPFSDRAVFRAFDLVLSCIPELVAQFREMGHRSEHLHHAFDPTVLSELPGERVIGTELSFVGQIVRGGRYHAEREELLKRVARGVPLEIFSPAYEIGWGDELKARLRQGLYGGMAALKAIGIPERALSSIPAVGRAARWKEMPPSPRVPGLGRQLRPPVFGLKMFRTLRASRVTLNSHIGVSKSSASNMRMFEATGVGTCLLTDWKENLHELFEDGREVVSYRSAAECLEKARWLLEHPQKAEEIGRAGQAAALRNHTFERRALRLHEIIQAVQKGKEARTLGHG